MRYNFENQKQRDLLTFRLVLEDYLYFRERNNTLILEHSEKAIVQWFSYITGLTVEVVNKKSSDCCSNTDDLSLKKHSQPR